jgi:hypothetical protein
LPAFSPQLQLLAADVSRGFFRYLTRLPAKAKNYANSGEILPARAGCSNPDYEFQLQFRFPKEPAMTACKHPRVQIVAREEDTEFVECLECREVFEASEFKDMTIEETNLNQEP